MTTLFFNQVEEQVINQVNNLPTQEEILLSQADENVYLNPISDNVEYLRLELMEELYRRKKRAYETDKKR